MIDDPARHARSASADLAARAADRRRVALLAVTILAIVALLATVGWQSARLIADNAIDDTRTELRLNSGAIVAQVLSRTGQSAADRDRARGLVTRDFARRTGLDGPAVPITDVAVRWTPSTVAVVDAGASSGSVLIDGTQVRTLSGRDTSTPQTIAADLVEVDGQWLVDQIDVVR